MSSAAANIRLSADVGGTFTDVAAFDETTGELRLGKTLTTPQRLVTGIENGVGKAGTAFEHARLFLHGTTVAINTILERSGARCALLTTQGFRDIYEIGRVNRPEAYNLGFRKHKPLIDRDLRFEIMERIDAQGSVLIKLDDEQIRATVKQAVAQGVQAVAILFLHSYRNPVHEQRAKAIIEREFPDLLRGKIDRYVIGLRRQLPDRAIDRWAVRHRRRPAYLHPHVGIGPGSRCDRHQGAVRFHWDEKRDRVRHGRYHRQGWRDLSG